MMNGIPEYYIEVLKAWGDYSKHVVCTSLNKNDILIQPLFLNKLLKRGEQTNFYKKWYNAGIRQIKDIMYEVIPGFLPVQVISDAIEENYEEESKVVLQDQYEKVKEIIPKEWINILEGDTEKMENDIPFKTFSHIKFLITFSFSPTLIPKIFIFPFCSLNGILSGNSFISPILI